MNDHRFRRAAASDAQRLEQIRPASASLVRAAPGAPRHGAAA